MVFNIQKILYRMRRYIPKTGKQYNLKIISNNNYKNYRIYQSDVELFNYMLNYIKNEDKRYVIR